MTWPMIEEPMTPQEPRVNRTVLAQGNVAEDITVVIPSIPPRAWMLHRALGSIYKQTLKPKDVIVELDRGHTGAAKTRTRGLMKVKTDLVAFLDDDDEFGPDHLKLLHDELVQTDADMVFPWFDVQGGTDPFPAHFGREWSNDEPRQTTITFMARTKLMKDIGGFLDDPTVPNVDKDGNRFGEDFAAVCRMVRRGAKIVHLPVRTWVWHHHGGNTSGLPFRWV